MHAYFLRLIWQFSLAIFFVFAGSSCRSDQRDQANQQTDQQNQSAGKQHKHRHHKRHQNPSSGYERTQQTDQPTVSSQGNIPDKVLKVLDYVRQNGRAPAGYVGGRTFGNFEGHLPKQGASGQRIRYQEWDVNPKVQGQNRGTERLITSSDNRAYFTQDHYNSFTEIK